ncbi:NifU family protein [Phenylobacterium sp. J367]|uniref:NifU family protein n=1 Tax=Phenylobacterium sp. J367 TaxID=2898435 RepID=UPI002150B0D6|nr:NifU family protein [Phenylobacterium sp. J367]MCR5878041.1 NifU family protein [Phenylobacterium sp. J367]
MFIQTEPTPNPEVLKFLPGRAVMGEGTRDFREAGEAAVSPLAADLFDIEGVQRVFFGPDFVTVGKHPSSDWPHLKAPILAAIMDHFTSGRPLFADQGDAAAGGHDEGVYEGETAQIVAEIKDLLDTRIRPAVAQDGGDILFSKFDEKTGVVWLNMRGACSGCPSSTATLKAGVENMLKHYVPEVTAVEQTLG